MTFNRVLRVKRKKSIDDYRNYQKILVYRIIRILDALNLYIDFSTQLRDERVIYTYILYV